jgi:hypothetical protein
MAKPTTKAIAVTYLEKIGHPKRNSSTEVPEKETRKGGVEAKDVQKLLRVKEKQKRVPN